MADEIAGLLRGRSGLLDDTELTTMLAQWQPGTASGASIGQRYCRECPVVRQC